MSTISRRAATLAMIPVCIVEVMTTQDFAIANNALGSMSHSFGVPVSQLHWALSSQFLAIGGLLIVAGWAGDRFGRRPLFVLGLCVAAVGNLCVSLSASFVILIAARVLTGIGMALILPTALSLIADVFPDSHDRDRAISAISIAQFVGLPSGALIGGVLMTHFGWQSGFLLNCALAIMSIPMALSFLPRSQRRPAGSINLDWAGIILVALCSALIVWTVSSIEASGPTSIQASVSIIVTLCLVGLLVAVERKARFPILPASIIRQSRFIRATALIGLITCFNVGLIFTFSLTLHSQGADPEASTWMLFVPMAIGSIVGSMLVGPLIKRSSRGFVTLLGLSTDLLLVLAFGLLKPRSLDAVPVIMFGASVAMLAVFVPVQTDAIEEIPEAMRGVVSSLIRMAYNLPTGIGVAIVAGAYAAGGHWRAVFTTAVFSVVGLIVFALTLRRTSAAAPAEPPVAP